jgi:GT2 family glycosyltransferase
MVDCGAAATLPVIVCAYNERQFLSACLHSLRAQSRPADDIIVIGNVSCDPQQRGYRADVVSRRVVRGDGWTGAAGDR